MTEGCVWQIATYRLLRMRVYLLNGDTPRRFNDYTQTIAPSSTIRSA